MNLRKIIVFCFFIFYFLIGFFIYKDYGISWDEPTQRQIGYVNFTYIFKGDKSLLNDIEQDHGPFIELPLVIIERALNMSDSRTIYFMRHLMNFSFFFISVVFFYLLVLRIYKNWKQALIACLFLIVSPRIFAESFYNSKDIPFLSLFIIATYALSLLLERQNWKRTIFLALTTAALIATRVLGVLFPVIVVGILLIDGLMKTKKTNNYVWTISIYMILSILFTILFWPILWTDQIANFVEIFKSMANFRFQQNLSVLYLGSYISPFSIPWHYIPV